MRIESDPEKESTNKRKHGLDFSFAALVFTDPLAVTVYDRHENGEDRWHTFGEVGGYLILVVHTYPDPKVDDWVRVIGLREATPHERKRYEEGSFD
ncbi:MAG TPA: BrnT family toxin [Acidisoma sp.]|jgi:uncharacterized DUF497 family protein|uniref:BrnT family toxin n=1 Tax=Acidisoma sp. TaxID=1872115 RepID=UPI002C625D9D|nr:BrnT family toxin [Acidisoma sp.]HTI03275.1 BrnT family toxin [Acidisoma sp.]